MCKSVHVFVALVVQISASLWESSSRILSGVFIYPALGASADLEVKLSSSHATPLPQALNAFFSHAEEIRGGGWGFGRVTGRRASGVCAIRSHSDTSGISCVV